MQHENHLNVGCQSGLHVDEVIPKKKIGERRRREPTKFIYLFKINNFWKIYVLKVNFTLARLASDLKFTLANRKFQSPWRVWRVLFPPLKCNQTLRFYNLCI